MPQTCAVCGQPTEKEPGFYYGTGYVSYALCVAISVATFIAWIVLIGMSVKEGDKRFFLLVCNKYCNPHPYYSMDDAHLKEHLDLLVCKV